MELLCRKPNVLPPGDNPIAVNKYIISYLCSTHDRRNFTAGAVIEMASCKTHGEFLLILIYLLTAVGFHPVAEFFFNIFL